MLTALLIVFGIFIFCQYVLQWDLFLDYLPPSADLMAVLLVIAVWVVSGITSVVLALIYLIFFF